VVDPSDTERVIVFDFDKTLTYCDTVFGFFWFAAQKHPQKYLYSLFYWSLIIMSKLKLIRLDKVKSLGIKWFLGHLDRKGLNACSEAYAKRIQLNQVYKDIYMPLASQSWIVSASLKCYLEPLFDPTRILGAEIEWNAKDRPSGLSKGCHGYQKVRLLAAEGISRIHVLYTDSHSDAPLGEIADQIFLVKGDNVKLVPML